MIPDLKALRFNLEALTAIGEADCLKGAWPILARMTQTQLATMEQQATAEAADAACRIEGLIPDPAARERYVAARATALNAARIDGLLLVALHEDLLRTGGNYKTEENIVAAFDADGKSLGAIFVAEKPENVDRRVTELMDWIETTLEDKDIHPLPAIGIFMALLLEIQPFDNGTTRLASILTTALMVRAGYGYSRYYALDRAIEAGKYSYYLALRRTVATVRTGEPDWHHWLDFFFRAIRQQARDLRDRIATDRAVGDDLPELSAKILAIVRAQGRVSVAAAALATGVSRNTIKDHIGRLTEQGLLTMHGAGRGAWYGLR